MKKTILFSSLLLFCLSAFAQTPSNLYGIVRKNYYSTVTYPFDSTITYEQLDSVTIRLGSADALTGQIANVSNIAYASAVNLTGAALNPYDSTYIFIGAGGINTFDLTSGLLINQAPLNNPIAASYFDNFRFNNADSTMYGLARRNTYDSLTGNNFGEVYLAKANTNTGLITQISPNSVAQGFALAGSAIDPYQMVYYFSVGSNLIGLDMYTGNIFSNVPFQINDGIIFDNFTYSCSDTALYGLIRQNYFSYVYDSILFPGDSIQYLDSSSIKLGRVDPNTGIVTTISPVSMLSGGYSLNAGSAIDPNTMTYFFSTGNNIVGVSLITGLITSNVQNVFADGNYFDLMRNFQNCRSAIALRANPNVLSVQELEENSMIDIFPNPASNALSIKSDNTIQNVRIFSLDGKEILNNQPNSSRIDIDLSQWSTGIYFAQITLNNEVLITKKFIRE